MGVTNYMYFHLISNPPHQNGVSLQRQNRKMPSTEAKLLGTRSRKGLVLQEIWKWNDKEVQEEVPRKVWNWFLDTRVRRQLFFVSGAKNIFVHRNNFGAPYPTPHRSDQLPTFWEFVQYLNSFSKVHTMDPHWRPTYVFCTPCSFSFRYILKFENFTVNNTN